MFDEENFKFNMENIKNDLAIEGMFINDADMDIYRKYANSEINMGEMIDILKNKPLGD